MSKFVAALFIMFELKYLKIQLDIDLKIILLKITS